MLIPPILFSASFTIDFHAFCRLFFQIFLLAVPGVIISALLIATSLIVLLPSDWNFESAMLLGSMLAATDPVSVVTLLKEVGAPYRLTVLIEGESLVNDGIAYALFVILLAQVSGESNLDIGQTIGTIVYVVVVGATIGIFGGIVTIRLMVYIWNDATMEISLTVIMTWGVFLLGDVFGASGVLAVVAYGLTFASRSISHVSGEVKVAMRQVWTFLEFVATSLIFFYSGVISAFSIVGNKDDGFLGWQYILYVLVLYIFVFIIRFVMVGMFYWILKKTGYGMDWRRALILSWSGLRGALGLIAAVEVAEFRSCEDEDPFPQECIEARLQSQIIFAMSEIVVLSILINGVTMQWLVAKLELAKRSNTARKTFEYNLSALNDIVGQQIADAKMDSDISGADFEMVWSFMPALSISRSEYRGGTNVHGKATDRLTYIENEEISNAPIKQGIVFNPVKNTKEAAVETRYRFLLFVKARYFHRFETGSCGSWPTLRILNEAVATSMDRLAEPLHEWDLLETYCHLGD